MADIIKPDPLNERFTLYLNSDGEPVQRTLREMTADEVCRAYQWHHDDCDRLQPAGDAAAAIWNDEEQRAALTRDQFKELSAVLDELIEVNAKAMRLARLIQATMPQWEDHPDMTMRDASRRWWPGGRHAA